MVLNTDWAHQQLDHFIDLTEFRPPTGQTGQSISMAPSRKRYNRGSQDEIIASAQIVEQILDRVLPRWRTEVPDKYNAQVNRWCQHREAAQRAEASLEREAEVRANLGDNAPHLSAASMHRWAWEGAQSLWQSGHFREAVTAAARKVNAETQNKVGRRIATEGALFQNVFSADAPKPGQPRLRLLPDDGSKTFTSVHRGVAMFAEGCFAAIRNPNSHEASLPELSEHEALEQLAAFSVLARWVDTAKLET
ncbi:TIGR02391 family protein [Kitasatospora sp. NPDC088391]|uniref:TIGR02391 family protein n=1 Tax=Kitasatospora sp. NPDC088391 TaxID=3364074 RepID=UPI00382FC739